MGALVLSGVFIDDKEEEPVDAIVTLNCEGRLLCLRGADGKHHAHLLVSEVQQLLAFALSEQAVDNDYEARRLQVAAEQEKSEDGDADEDSDEADLKSLFGHF